MVFLSGKARFMLTVNRQRLYRFVYQVFIFLSIYIPFLKIGGIQIHLPYLYFFGLSLLFIYIVTLQGTISKSYIHFISLFWFGCFYFLFIGFINGNFDKITFIGFIPGTLSVLGTYAIVRLFYRKISNSHSYFLIQTIFYAGLIHALIMVLSFFVAPFRNALYSIVSLGDKGESFIEYMVRSPGLTTGGGDSLSVIQALALIFGIYYYSEIIKKTSFIKSVFYIFSFLLLTLSILLSARTGLVIFFLFIIWLFIYRIKRFFVTAKISRSFVIKSLLTSLIFAVVIFIGYQYLINSEYSRFIRRSFELFINYFETGEATTTSTDRIMEEMFIFPQNNIHLLFGDGNMGRNDDLPYVHSDIGYVRMIYGGGIFGSLIFLAPLAYAILLAKRHYRVDKHLSIMVVITVLAILITNLKVFHYFEFRESFKILYFLVASIGMRTTINK